MKLEIKRELVPREETRQAGKANCLEAKKAFEDPAIVQEFKNWQEARKNTQRSAKA